MPFASFNLTNPRTNPWNFHKKILRIGGVGKSAFFKSAILNFFFKCTHKPENQQSQDLELSLHLPLSTFHWHWNTYIFVSICGTCNVTWAMNRLSSLYEIAQDTLQVHSKDCIKVQIFFSVIFKQFIISFQLKKSIWKKCNFFIIRKKKN